MGARYSMVLEAQSPYFVAVIDCSASLRSGSEHLAIDIFQPEPSEKRQGTAFPGKATI